MVSNNVSGSRHVSFAMSCGRQQVEFGKPLIKNKNKSGPRDNTWVIYAK